MRYFFEVRDYKMQWRHFGAYIWPWIWGGSWIILVTPHWSVQTGLTNRLDRDTRIQHTRKFCCLWE